MSQPSDALSGPDDSRSPDAGDLLYENRLGRLAEVIPGALFAFRMKVDGSMAFTYVSPGYEALTGVSVQAVLQDSSLTFARVLPDDLPGLMASIEDSARRLNPWLQEFRLQHPDRGLVWVEGRSVPEREADGSLLWHGLFLDITERKRAEAELREQDERVRAILESAPFGAHAFELKPNGDLLFTGFNPAAERILGISHAELVGKPILEAFPSLLGTQVPESYRRVALEGGRFEDEQIAYSGDEIQGVFEIHAFQTAPHRMAVFFRDITERKKAELALRDSEHLMEKTQEISRIGSYRMDLSEGVFHCSAVLDEILGIDASYTRDMQGWESLIHPDDREGVRAQMAECLAGAREFQKEYRICRPSDQAERWLYGTGSLERDEEGRPRRLLGIVQDITERKRVEETFRQEQAITNAVMDSVPGMLYLYDAEGHLIRWNKQHEILTGYSSEELGKMTLLDWYKDSPEDIERILAGVRTCLEQGFGEADANLQTKGGGRILCHLNAVRLELQGKTHFVGIGLDVTKQRKAEAEIRARDERIRAILEAAPFGAHTFEQNLDGDLILVGFNQVADRILGSSHVDRLGKPLLEAFPRLKGSSVPEAYARALETGERVETELVVREDRQIKAALEIHAFRTEPGRMSVFFRDVSDRKREEQALRDSEQLMEETQKVVRIGSYRLDLISGEFQSSKVLDDIMGFTESTPKNLSTWESVLHPEDRVEVAAYMTDCVVSRHPFQKEYRIVRMGDGAVRWMRGTGSLEFDAEGRPTRMLGVIQDFTEQYLAEKTYREEQAITQALMESVPGLLYLYDMEGNLLRWNRQHETLTGYSAEELRTRTLMDWYEGSTPEELDLVQQAIRQTHTDGRYEGESRIRMKNGERVLYHFNAARLDVGEKSYLVGTGNDVTEQRRAEEEIRHLNETLEERVRLRTEALEAANRELDSFTYSVSHDLRAPLRSVDGFSLALQEDYSEQLPEEGRRYIELIRGGAQRMGALIDDLLKFSRMGRAPLNRQTLSMDALLGEVLGELRIRFDDPELQLQIGPMPSCEGDPGLLRQVWINLVSNALKYSRKSHPARVEIGFDAQQDCYFVRDNGVGFDMKYAGKLFQVFQRLHRLEDFEGTGVGLALVRQILNRHEGKIWAEGHPGQGACFRFRLPREGGVGHA